MGWVLLVIGLILGCFGFVLLFGAPYLPTLTAQAAAALDLSQLRPGQTLLELGCGDGKVLLAAAARGYHVVGYELNPLLAAVAWLRTRRYRRQVQVICGDFWRADWPPAQAVFVFLLDRFMPRLDARLQAAATRQGSLRLVSFAFQIPGKRPAAQRAGVYAYDYR